MSASVKDLLTVLVKYNEEADAAVARLLSGLSNEEREKDRKSYYGSLSGLFRHVTGGTAGLLGMCREAAAGSAAALKALEPLAGATPPPKGALSAEQWKQIAANAATADRALVNFVEALSDVDAPVKLSWYNGKPPSVPLWFMLQQIVAHGTHHRGQISQILDSLKIDNDYSGINVKFLG